VFVCVALKNTQNMNFAPDLTNYEYELVAELLNINLEKNTERRIQVCQEIKTSRKKDVWSDGKFDSAFYTYLHNAKNCIEEFKKYTCDFNKDIILDLYEIVQLSQNIGPYNMSRWPYEFENIEDPLYALIMNIWTAIYDLTNAFNGENSNDLINTGLLMKDIYADLFILHTSNTTWFKAFKKTIILHKNI
jgi:hypothetical protein